MWPPVILFPVFVHVMLVERSGSQKEASLVVSKARQGLKTIVQIAPNFAKYMKHLVTKLAIIGKEELTLNLQVQTVIRCKLMEISHANTRGLLNVLNLL